MTDFRAAFPDLNFWGTADLIAEGDYCRWPVGRRRNPHRSRLQGLSGGSLPAATGRTMRFTGTTVLKVIDGKIAEEVGLDDGVTALTQLGLHQGRLIERRDGRPVYRREQIRGGPDRRTIARRLACSRLSRRCSGSCC